MASMIQCSEIYLIPLFPGQRAIAAILGLGSPAWNPRLKVMHIVAFDRIVVNEPPRELPGNVVQQCWCSCSFVEEGNWSLVRRGEKTDIQFPPTPESVWLNHELFLDDLRKRLGLGRQTYQSAERTFSDECSVCGGPLYPGFARCSICRAIRKEFKGLERFVVDKPGPCCRSGAPGDVRDQNGNYYWAPYFIDMVNAGEIPGVVRE
jgi:hypothetical protein